jgi:hypothetical protein
MLNHALCALAAYIGKRACVTVEDVQRLRREILPDGLASLAEADVLMGIDRAAPDADVTWEDFLVEALVDFVVWTSRPTGYVDADTTDWLIASLAAGGGPVGAAQRIVFEIIREAEHVEEGLLIFALRSAHRRGRFAAELDKVAGAA